MNLPNTHCSYLAPVKSCLWRIRSLIHLDFGTRGSSTKAAWQSAKISETTSWYLATTLYGVEAWGSHPSNCCPQFPVVGDAGITVTIESCSEAFLVSSPVLHSDFHILYVSGQYIEVGRLHSELRSPIFSGWLTPGDIVKLEVFKKLHWGLGNGYYISCLDLKWPAMTMHSNMKTITSNLLPNHPRQLQESL